MATKKATIIEENEDVMSLFKASMGESIKEPEEVKYYYDTGNLCLNYIGSKNLRGAIPSGRITCFEGLSSTGKSLICCNVLKDKNIDFAVCVETEGGGLSKELLEYVGVDTKKVSFCKANTFECYRTNKKNQCVEAVAEKDMPQKLETDQYVYTEGITYLIKKVIDTVRYNPKLCDKKIVIILDSLGNALSVKSLNGVADVGCRAKEINRFFQSFDGVLEKTGISLIFTNKLYTDIMNSSSMYGPTYTSAGGESVFYNPSLIYRLATTAATDDKNDSEIKENREGKTTALGTSFKTLTASVMKSRFGTENRRIQFMLETTTGLSRLSGLFKMLKDYGIIQQNGSRYSCPCLWEDSFYKKDFIAKFSEDEENNIDKLQVELDKFEESLKNSKLKISDSDPAIELENEAETNILGNYVDSNDMISAIEN